MLAALATLVLTGASDYRTQFPLSSPEFGSGWGVNIHFTREESPGEVRKIASAGFKWVRVPLHWGYVEDKPNTYRFGAYDELMENLKRQRIRPMFILCFGNPNYGSGPPVTQRQREAFGRYVRASVDHFKGQGAVWELWNEPNYAAFWQPQPNATEYIALLREVGAAVRQTAPEEWLIGPATSGFDWPYLQACVDGGALEYFDAISVHPYRQENPESALADFECLRKLIDTRKPIGRDIAIVNSEWGYSESYRDMSAKSQGWMAPRMYLVGLAAGVKLSIYFDWKNNAGDSRAVERSFGAVDETLRPKPAFKAIQKASNELRGYRFLGRLPTAGHIYGMAFQRGSRFKVVGWSTTERGTLRFAERSIDVTGEPKFFGVRKSELQPYFPTELDSD